MKDLISKLKSLFSPPLVLSPNLKMKKILIDHISKSLTNVGLNILHGASPFNVWRLALIYMFYFTVEISICMKSITNHDNFNAFITPAPYVAAITVSLGCMHIVYNYRNLIREMLYRLDTNLYNYRDENMMNIKDHKWYLQNDNIFLLIAIIRYGQYVFLVVVCIPILAELSIYHRIKTFIYPCWTPWHLDNLQTELFTFIMQFVQSAGGLWFNHVIIVLILILVVEFVKQYERLIAAILSLKLRTSRIILEQKGNQKIDSYDQVMRENIIHCIRHHQELYKCFRIFKIWFTAFFSLELAICMVTFAFALYVVVNASSVSQIINYFTVVSFIWINLLGRCLISEVFTSLNEDLAKTLFYETDWHEASESNKRLLLIFHQLARRPLRLFGLSVFEATRATFAKLVRTTYSIFNVLNFSMKK